jgi:hypothetical protein
LNLPQGQLVSDTVSAGDRGLKSVACVVLVLKAADEIMTIFLTSFGAKGINYLVTN